MENWSQLEALEPVLASHPERLAPFRRRRDQKEGTRDELERGFEVVRRGLEILGPIAPGEPKIDDFPDLGQLRNDFAREAGDFRAVTAQRLRSFLEARRSEIEAEYLKHGLTMVGIARFYVRALLGQTAPDLMKETPSFHQPDPEGLRALALQWLDDHAELLREMDIGGCLYIMINREAEGLIPVATRLYHNPAIGPEVRETIEEIFVPEVVEQIRAGAPS